MNAVLSPPLFGNFPASALSNLWAALSALPGAGAGREQDRRLVEEALAGGPGFEKLVRAHEAMVYRTAFRFLGQEADALDVAQEVFLRVHRSLPQFRGDSALSTWIYAITANLSKNALRSRKTRVKWQVLSPARKEEGGEWLAQAEDKKARQAPELMESGEFRRALEGALAHLPPDFKEAVVLRDLEGLDYAEISQVLKLGLGTVKSRIARGRALLRDRLRDWL